ncbi:ArsR family transcriptional regulator [Brachybacterium endophyticum]|uniref:ArsR family transcriptional regulator n=1 Tax=Brachybacterium endophyticum TaxID=2182385 RepID=A0A2U2RPM4_9MICO|nr:transcriptional regulator [Brachybacterium endophyticum]PWH07828.1 ArsR family transcriptional regulator [Brachybacterium endophyticum]
MSAPDRSHPRFRLENELAHPVRFSIVAALAAVESLVFGELRDELQVSDSVLSKQITELENAGFVKVSKGFVGKRPRTTLSLTKEGVSRWRAHLETLQAIAGTP